MLPRPRIRIPLSLAAAIVAGLYLARSAVRGFDFRPDLPIDAVVGAAFLLVLGIVAYLRHDARDVGAPKDLAAEQNDPPGASAR